MSDLREKRIVLGITGGIAAYKAAELLRLLVRANARVDVVMTEAATQFVAPLTFQALSGNPVWVDQWDLRQPNGLSHIDLSRNADAILVAPATANFLARAANGIANDLLTSLVLARNCPLLAAPAMNLQMWNNPATQRNVEQLRADGVTLLGPASGEQACGEVGEGRMLEPEEIFSDLESFFQPKRLAGRSVLITAGPTFEAIDPVRGITNPSSGKMGFAMARACAEAGAIVTMVAGPSAEPTPRGVRRIDVKTAIEMRDAVMRELPTDIFIAVAAVADYRPAKHAEQKIKKSTHNLTLELIPNPDILSEVAALPKPPFCVGFAAESQNLAEYAENKRRQKKLPLVVGNLIQNGLGGDTNQVTLFAENGTYPLAAGPKLNIARGIIGHLASMLKGKD